MSFVKSNDFYGYVVIFFVPRMNISDHAFLHLVIGEESFLVCTLFNSMHYTFVSHTMANNDAGSTPDPALKLLKKLQTLWESRLMI